MPIAKGLHVREAAASGHRKPVRHVSERLNNISPGSDSDSLPGRSDLGHFDSSVMAVIFANPGPGTHNKILISAMSRIPRIFS